MTLQIVPPVTVTSSNLTSTTIAEPDTGEPALWNSGSTYTVGQTVTRATTHAIYKATGSIAAGVVPEDNPTSWTKIGSTNRYAMFDLSNSSATTSTSDIVVEVTPGQSVSSVYLSGLKGGSVKCELIDSIAGTVYTKTISLQSDSNINNWWSYFFTPIETTDFAVFDDLPAFYSAKVKITIYAVSSLAACGSCLIGLARAFGYGIELGAEVGRQSFSRKVINDFGEYELKKRNSAKRASFAMKLDNSQIDSFQNFLDDIDTIPCLFIGYAPIGATIVFGFYRSFNTTIAYHEFSHCTLNLEGLT